MKFHNFFYDWSVNFFPQLYIQRRVFFIFHLHIFCIVYIIFIKFSANPVFFDLPSFCELSLSARFIMSSTSSSSSSSSVSSSNENDYDRFEVPFPTGSTQPLYRKPKSSRFVFTPDVIRSSFFAMSNGALAPVNAFNKELLQKKPNKRFQ